MNNQFYEDFKAYKKGYKDGFDDRKEDIVNKFKQAVLEKGCLMNSAGTKTIHMSEEKFKEIVEGITVQIWVLNQPS